MQSIENEKLYSAEQMLCYDTFISDVVAPVDVVSFSIAKKKLPVTNHFRHEDPPEMLMFILLHFQKNDISQNPSIKVSSVDLGNAFPNSFLHTPKLKYIHQ